eukprot:10768519-Alexandrium_andersonii.AAC.1
MVERGILAEVAHVSGEILEDNIVPVPLAQEALRRVEPHLGGNTDAAEVGNVDGKTQLATQRPEA